MAGKPISTRCKYIVTENGHYEQCQSCGDGYCTKECAEVSIACKIFHKYTYVFVINSILLYVLYSDFFLWLSKGNLRNPKFFIAQGALFLLMALTIVVHLVRKHRRLGRIKLHYKVIILRDIIEPQTQKSSFIRLSEILTRAIYGAPTTQSIKESFLEKISGMSKDSALQYLDEFIDAYLLSDYRLSVSVTKREHKVDKKEWKRLESKFNPPANES